MSRWTMPSVWAYCSASQIFGTIVSACADGILPVCNNCRKFKPSTNSISR